jgi:iron complex outermembrane recepter protein
MEEAYMLKPRIAILMACTVLTALPATPISAQAPPGKIAGTVRVASGAPVAGAPITIMNQDTGATRVVRSSASGAYEAADLPPGLYTVSADVQGFRKVVRKDQQLVAGGTLTVDVALELKLAAEATVTAMKREDTVSSVPVSVAAPDASDIRERGIENIEGVAANVAGFSVQNLGPGQSQVAMRGISSGQIARDQPGVKESVGAYLDESVISMSLFTPDLDFFDVSRVEVLRGPQGTLFGSGSLSGTVRYITNQPELGATKYFAELSGNTVSGGSQGGNAKFGFNAPLGGKAALRIAAYYDALPGYMDAVQPNLSVKNDVNTGRRGGVRAAVEIAPDEHLTITPRIVYQDVKTDGWNRIDAFNILANPFTTTRPAVALGDRQFTQLGEPYTDKFWLGDLNVKYDFGGGVALTSVTSYTHRDILVVRDAGALTSSITGGSFGLPQNVYTLNAPLDDATTAQGWTEELRLAGGNDKFKWVGGAFYADQRRRYGQNLLVSGYEALVPSGDFVNTRTIAPKDVLFYSNLDYKLTQFALFGEATVSLTDRLNATAGLRYEHYSEDKAQVFDGLFGAGGDGKPVSQPGTTKADVVAPRFILSYKVTDATTLNAQFSKGFRLGGVNDPTNFNLCTPQDRVTFSGRESWKDETAWNYEIGTKSKFLGGRGTVGVSGFYEDINDLQVTVTAGSCSSRLIFNVPKARSIGAEFELGVVPNEHFDFSLSAAYTDSQIRSTIPGTPDLVASTGIREGNRLPSVAKFQAALSATYQQPVTRDFIGYVTGTYNHVGSRYTQLADQEPGTGTLNLNSFGAHTIGGPLTQSTFTFDPLMPAYDLVNLRLGVRHAIWDIALYVNNLTNEQALLALDRERGLRARVSFLVNQPRTFGLTTRFDF